MGKMPVADPPSQPEERMTPWRAPLAIPKRGAMAWWVLVLALLLESITVVRAVREERILESVFGEEYRQYRERTWF